MTFHFATLIFYAVQFVLHLQYLPRYKNVKPRISVDILRQRPTHIPKLFETTRVKVKL